MGKKKCLVLEISSGIHEDQSLEFQVEDLSRREKDHKFFQELESLIFKIFQNEAINGMQHEVELISKSEIFYET